METRRVVKTSQDFLTKLDYYFGSEIDRVPSTRQVLLNEVIPYVLEAFAQDWDSLPLVDSSDPLVRFHEFLGDDIPHAFFIGEISHSPQIEGTYLVQEILLVDAIVDFGEECLEDPAEIPDR